MRTEWKIQQMLQTPAINNSTKISEAKSDCTKIYIGLCGQIHDCVFVCMSDAIVLFELNLYR